MTYAALQAQVIDWSHRSDLAARIPGFIELAERELFRELSLRAEDVSISGIASTDTIAIPAGINSIERVEIEAHGHRYTLSYSSPNGIAALTGAPNTPSRYVIEASVIRLLPPPDGPYDYTIYSTAEIDPLSDATPTNWLLENHVDLYLKAVLLQVAKFTKNAEDTARLMQEVGIALDAVRRADERKRFPIAGGLQIKPRSYR